MHILDQTMCLDLQHYCTKVTVEVGFLGRNRAAAGKLEKLGGDARLAPSLLRGSRFENLPFDTRLPCGWVTRRASRLYAGPRCSPDLYDVES
jgi:hypothetical protein